MNQATRRITEERIRKKERRIAYLSMEIGIAPKMPTYSGGLGILAGDTIKSAADLKVPVVAVTLIYKKGYFRQEIDKKGAQHELPYEWNPRKFMKLRPQSTEIRIEGRRVKVQAWEYRVRGATGYNVPVFFLDTDIEGNSEYDRSLVYHLYGGDERYRLAQEVILGIGGLRILKELGYRYIRRYHMNEGHSSLLTLELLRQKGITDPDSLKVDEIRKMCIFTTHTPIPAGHDQFPYKLARKVLGNFLPIKTIRAFAGKDNLNMTRLALNLSRYVNGVAKEHQRVSREMFPGYQIDSITNGIHVWTWASDPFRDLFSRFIPGWKTAPPSLRYAISIPDDEIWKTHVEAKRKLIDYVNATTDAEMDPEVITIGFARRATAYKRADLIFTDMARLKRIARKVGKMQFIYAGKAHPKDIAGKKLIKRILAKAKELKGEIEIVYLEDYNMRLARLIVAGVDVWLNTPLRPREASGTSGMKAAVNGVPSLSSLDGWWIEGCIEGMTGWAIGSLDVQNPTDQESAKSLYYKLEREVIPAFYYDRKTWVEMMRLCIAINGSFFNTHRMVHQYMVSAYTQ
ncbi:alpha-glucan family phosphorylase [Candidatus Eisenbacteria bacterium]|uniref:Alpha-glucan family phosphorylase n=1 Tax=Eiseniibacteriota bacterium TaxID=2212470 RepID=A0ABV6YN32_UNCEI